MRDINDQVLPKDTSILQPLSSTLIIKHCVECVDLYVYRRYENVCVHECVYMCVSRHMTGHVHVQGCLPQC